MAGTTGVKKKK
jgi:hypothetical protein